MSDIFISYSSKDREKAEQLTELLRSKGYSCWIDTQGIGAATLWSSEIVTSISECSIFILLLSRASVLSPNVLREVLLAMEKGKKVVPVLLEDLELPHTFEYPLAGLQRVNIRDQDAILRAVVASELHPFTKDYSRPKKRIQNQQVLKIFVFGVFTLAMLIGIYSIFFSSRSSDSGDRHSIAVVPFENLTGDSSQRYFVAGFT